MCSSSYHRLYSRSQPWFGSTREISAQPIATPKGPCRGSCEYGLGLESPDNSVILESIPKGRLTKQRWPQYWLLKAPACLFYLREFAAHYPGARFVMTHRDPAAAIPSPCSVVEAARRLLVPNWSFDPATLGREVLEHFFDGIQQATADRAALGEERFIDIGQKELEADGVGTAGVRPPWEELPFCSPSGWPPATRQF